MGTKTGFLRRVALLIVTLAVASSSYASVNPGFGGGRGAGGICTDAYITPWGCAFWPDGSFFVADSGGNSIRRCIPGGTTMDILNASYRRDYTGDLFGPATAATASAPLNVAFDAAGTVYAVEGNHVRAVSNGLAWTAVPNGSFTQPQSIAVLRTADKTQWLLVGDVGGNKVFAWRLSACSMQTGCGPGQVVAGTGFFGVSPDGLLATATKMTPAGLSVTKDGSFLVADNMMGCVRKVQLGGTVTTVAGICGQSGFLGDGGDARQAKLYAPVQAVEAPNGDIYIADNFNHRIRKVDGQTKIISTVLGTGQQSTGARRTDPLKQAISYPGGVAVNPTGSLVAACSSQDAICFFIDTTTSPPTITPSASTPTALPPTMTATLTHTAIPSATRTAPPTMTATAEPTICVAPSPAPTWCTQPR